MKYYFRKLHCVLSFEIYIAQGLKLDTFLATVILMLLEQCGETACITISQALIQTEKSKYISIFKRLTCTFTGFQISWCVYCRFFSVQFLKIFGLPQYLSSKRQAYQQFLLYITSEMIESLKNGERKEKMKPS